MRSARGGIKATAKELRKRREKQKQKLDGELDSSPFYTTQEDTANNAEDVHLGGDKEEGLAIPTQSRAAVESENEDDEPPKLTDVESDDEEKEAQELEDFMVPKIVEFRDSLPKTDSGKIRRNALGEEGEQT